MQLDKLTVFVHAEPVLGTKLVINGFEKYVKHWLVSGYSWDGDCLCTAVHFKEVILPIHTLKVSTNELKHKLQEI